MTKRDGVFLLGAGMLLAGVAFVHWPAALIIGGVAVLLVAKRMDASDGKGG